MAESIAFLLPVLVPFVSFFVCGGIGIYSICAGKVTTRLAGLWCSLTLTVSFFFLAHAANDIFYPDAVSTPLWLTKVWWATTVFILVLWYWVAVERTTAVHTRPSALLRSLIYAGVGAALIMLVGGLTTDLFTYNDQQAGPLFPLFGLNLLFFSAAVVIIFIRAYRASRNSARQMFAAFSWSALLFLISGLCQIDAVLYPFEGDTWNVIEICGEVALIGGAIVLLRGLRRGNGLAGQHTIQHNALVSIGLFVSASIGVRGVLEPRTGVSKNSTISSE